ncbi:hypothetical protein PR048_003913 [Dryococelus australis]|uniref:Uncharacterized protein n=1 Tax=Dryococelus australis TaxID=614101 RepID=A0ABQ9IQW4_9NEOP|nr:hypothetical protein PR048_003913 [Dryococelus australis]
MSLSNAHWLSAATVLGDNWARVFQEMSNTVWSNSHIIDQPGVFQRVRDFLRLRVQRCITMNGRHIEHILHVVPGGSSPPPPLDRLLPSPPQPPPADIAIPLGWVSTLQASPSSRLVNTAGSASEVHVDSTYTDIEACSQAVPSASGDQAVPTPRNFSNRVKVMPCPLYGGMTRNTGTCCGLPAIQGVSFKGLKEPGREEKERDKREVQSTPEEISLRK